MTKEMETTLLRMYRERMEYHQKNRFIGSNIYYAEAYASALAMLYCAVMGDKEQLAQFDTYGEE